MRRTTVYLDEEQVRLLRHLATEEGRSFAEIVREALDGYLARRRTRSTPRVIGPRRLIPKEEWRSSFEAAVQRIRAGVATNVSPEEIEAEITAAAEEVRQERATRRRTRPRA